MSAMPNVTNVTEVSEAFMRADLMRSGLVPEDFAKPPTPLLPLGEHARYRLWYTDDYYKDRIDREDNKYIGPKGVTPATPILSLDQTMSPAMAFQNANVNAVVEGLKKSVLFTITTGVPAAVMDSCWGFGESTDGEEAKQVKNELLDGLLPGKVHFALFDGDWLTNDDVAKALATYSMQLDSFGVRGIFPDFSTDEGGNRRGFDDWFVDEYGTDRTKWPDSDEVIAALLALPQVPVTELEAARKYALGSIDLFNKGHVDFSDRGNATQFARLVGSNNMRFLTDAKKWVFWIDGRWREFEELPIQETNVVARHYYRRAERLGAIAAGMPADDAHAAKKKRLLDQVNLTQKWAKGHCSSVPGRKSILQDVQSRRDFQAKLSDFDADPLVLAVANGVVDLRTGKLRAEVQDDLILKRCTPEFSEVEPTGPNVDRIKKFLVEITGEDHGKPNAERLRWLHRRLGASLQGRNALDSLEIWHGVGSNGKSVLSGLIESTLGDYAKTIPPGAIMTSVRGLNPEGATPFLSMAIGRRIVFMSESKDTEFLNEQLVKQVTGGDRLNTRELYKGGGEHEVTFTPILLTNALPQVAQGDLALWDRMAPFAFRVRWRRPSRLSYDADEAALPLGDTWFLNVAKDDPDVQRWILWWLVQGGVERIEQGLGPVPMDIEAGLRTYKDAQNKLGRWMEDEGFVFDLEGKTKSGEVYGSYARWIEAEGGKAEKANIFSSRLIEYSKNRVSASSSNGVRILKGIRKTTTKKYESLPEDS